LAIQMRLDDLRANPGKQPQGAEKLIARMQVRAGMTPGLNVDRWISPEQLRRSLSKDLKANEVKHVDLDKVEPFLRSYLVRLSVVKTTFNLNGELTEAEAKAALRVYYEFNDPYGETVDLIPQFAIVHELAEREANSLSLDDIDRYFAFAPWKSDANKDLYWLAIIHRKAMPSQLRLICPFIPAAEPLQNLTGIPEPSPFDAHFKQIGAHAHLGMPYALNYSTPFGSGKNPKTTRYMLLFWDSTNLISKSPEEFRDLCGWKSEIRNAITDDFSKAVKASKSSKKEEAKKPTLERKDSEVISD
jgi:hypothetical protein